LEVHIDDYIDENFILTKYPYEQNYQILGLHMDDYIEPLTSWSRGKWV